MGSGSSFRTRLASGVAGCCASPLFRALSSLRCTFLGASSLARSGVRENIAAREEMPCSISALAVANASVASMLALKRNSRTSPSAAFAIYVLLYSERLSQ